MRCLMDNSVMFPESFTFRLSSCITEGVSFIFFFLAKSFLYVFLFIHQIEKNFFGYNIQKSILFSPLTPVIPFLPIFSFLLSALNYVY